MKRRAFKLLLFLLVGAIINVAVTWGIALTTDYGQLPLFQQLPLSSVKWPDYVARFQTLPPTSVTRLKNSWTTEIIQIGGIDSSASDMMIFVVQTDVGWPARSMTWHRPGSAGPASGARQIARIKQVFPRMSLWTGIPPFLPGMTSPLPLKFKFVGTLLNVIFYAFLFWLAFFAPWEARRRYRKRRGLCLKCGYPKGISDRCTECGAELRNVLVSGRQSHAAVNFT